MSKTTVEEIEIIVTAKVEEALREFSKIKPQLMQIMKEVSKEISKVDFNELNQTVREGTDKVKKQIKSTFNPEELDDGLLKAIDKLCAESLKKTAQYTKSTKEELSKVNMQDVGKKVAQATKQVTDAMNTTNIQQIAKNVGKAIKETKDKLEQVKDLNKSNEIKLDINNEDALKQITQLEKEIESLQKKITSREMKLNVTTGTIDKIRYSKQEEIRNQNSNLSDIQVSNRADFQLSSDTGYTSLISQADKLNTEIIKYNSLLEGAKAKIDELKQNTSISKSRAMFNAVGSGMKGAFNTLKAMSSGFNRIIQSGNKLVNVLKKITPNLSGGMKSLFRYVATLVSLKSIYNVLNSAGQAWLSSQDTGAKQLSANIEYMKYALGSAVAPVIQYVTNLFYQLLKSIQSVVYALFKVNIFAKAGASAYNSMVNNANKASKANKSLASIHSEINNVSSSSGDSTNSASAPNIDFSNLDTELTPIQQRLVDFFRSLVESWNTYSPQLISKAQETFGQIGLLLESIGKSFINIFANGTVYSILENILSIIGNIAEAFANAWNYNGNGDIIIQNLATALNNLLIAINNVVQSPGFQEWLNNCSDKFGEITDKLAEINWQPLIDALSQIGQGLGSIALDILSGLVDIFKWLVENPILAEIITGIAVAISAVSTAIGIISSVMAILNPILATTEIALGPLILIILGVVAAIAAVGVIIVECIKHWDDIKEATSKAIEAMKEFISKGIDKIEEIFTNIINWIKENWQGLLLLLVNPFAGAFKLLYDNCEEFRKFIDGFVEKIKNFFKDLWTNIQNILSNIGNFFSNIFHSIGNTVSNVFNGIWNTIKSVINCILGGIESMANGIVWGVNKVIDVLNNLNVHIPDWIPVFGGKDIGFHINQMSTVSLPRLAKGGILTSATAVMAAEYPGAKQNPEIFTPENLLYNTQVKALKDTFSDGGFNNAPIYMTVIVGNKKIGQLAIEDIKDIKRATGEDLEVIFGQ